MRIAAAFVVGRHQPVLPVGRITADCVANQPAFAPVPAGADRDPVGRAVKMVVVEHQRFDCGVRVVALDAGADGGEVALMHDFIAFQVERPVAGAGVLRDHFLLRIDETAIGHALVPAGLDDSDFWVDDGAHPRQRVVGALSDRHDKLIDQRKQRSNRRFEREPQLNAIANKGKTTDRHAHPVNLLYCSCWVALHSPSALALTPRFSESRSGTDGRRCRRWQPVRRGCPTRRFCRPPSR